MHKNGHDRWCSRCPKGDRLAAQRCITEALLSDIGEVTGTVLASEWLTAFEAMSRDEMLAFLEVLARDFGPDVGRISAATGAWAASGSSKDYVAFRLALHSPRMEIFRRVNRAPGGIELLLKMRTLVLDEMAAHPILESLDIELVYLFGLWFNRGFLTIERIDWNAPASLLEKVAEYEQVQAVQDWRDLRRRVAADRRIFGFFHPRLVGEPIIFVEVALTDGMPSSTKTLLTVDSPVMPREKVNTAVFYSINNCQAGLRGVGFGDLLIKQVMEELAKEGVKLELAVTLSPIPRLAHSVQSALAAVQREGADAKRSQALTPERLERLIAPFAEALCAASGKASGREALQVLLEDPWQHRELLWPVLKRVTLAYLALAKRGKSAFDPVANFHLTNGSRIERINVFADPSEKGLKQSFGAMLNYRYIPDLLEENHEAYVRHGTVSVGPELAPLLEELRETWG